MSCLKYMLNPEIINQIQLKIWLDVLHKMLLKLLSRLNRRDCQCWEPLPLLEAGHGHRLAVKLVQVNHQRALGVAGKPVHQNNSTSESRQKTL